MLAFGIPADTPGLRFICREPFDDGTQSPWDHPLGARFEEPDAVCVFDDVLIPWDRVFLYGDVKMGNALFAQASLRNHTGHQTAIRGLAKTPVRHRRRGRDDAHRQVRRVPARAGAARRTARLPAADRGRDPDGGAEGRADGDRRDPSGLRAAAGAALSPAQDVRAHGAGDAGAGRRRPPDQPDRGRPALRGRPRHRALLSRRRRSTRSDASISSSSPGMSPARSSASACCNTSATMRATRCGSAPATTSTTTSSRCSPRSSARWLSRSEAARRFPAL